MTKARSRQRIRNYLATIGWSVAEIEGMLAMPVRQNVEALEDLLVESAEGRRKLREARTHFPNLKIEGIS